MGREGPLPLHCGDFIAATSEWSGLQQGLYLLLLAHQWSIGSLPNDHGQLATLAKLDRSTFDDLWLTVSQKFLSRGDGRLVNARLEEYRAQGREVSKIRSELGKRGAARRWQNDSKIAIAIEPKTDGNSHESAKQLPSNSLAIAIDKPVLLESYSSPNPNPDISVGDSEGSGLERGERGENLSAKKSMAIAIPSPTLPELKLVGDPPTAIEKKKHERSVFVPAGLDHAAWELWLDYRKQIRKPLKPVSYPLAQTALAEFGKDQMQVVRQSMQNGYQGLFDVKVSGYSKPAQSDTDAAETVWPKVRAAIQASEWPADFADSVARQAVGEMGGLQSLGQRTTREGMFTKREFLTTYQRLLKQVVRS